MKIFLLISYYITVMSVIGKYEVLRKMQEETINNIKDYSNIIVNIDWKERKKRIKESDNLNERIKEVEKRLDEMNQRSEIIKEIESNKTKIMNNMKNTKESIEKMIEMMEGEEIEEKRKEEINSTIEEIKQIKYQKYLEEMKIYENMKVDVDNKYLIMKEQINEEITYSIYSNGKMKIEGKGGIKEIPLKMNIGEMVKEEIKEINIGQGITRMEEGVIKGYSNLEKVKIPSSIKYIGKNNFSECPQLKTIEIEEGMKYIGDKWFSSCNNIKEINIPSSVKYISKTSFKKCTSIKNIKLNNNPIYYFEEGCIRKKRNEEIIVFSIKEENKIKEEKEMKKKEEQEEIKRKEEQEKKRQEEVKRRESFIKKYEHRLSNEYIKNNISALEEWSGSKINQVLYNSTIDGSTSDTFRDKIMNHSKLYFIVIDENNNVFGHYHNETVDKTDCYLKDEKSFMFTLFSNGRCGTKTYRILNPENTTKIYNDQRFYGYSTGHSYCVHSLGKNDSSYFYYPQNYNENMTCNEILGVSSSQSKYIPKILIVIEMK